jgi:hypothetical protein
VIAFKKKNCPKEFKESFKSLIEIKKNIKELKKEECSLLHMACVSDPEKKLPTLSNHEQIMKIASCINLVAINITQIDKFKQLIANVLKISLVKDN